MPAEDDFLRRLRSGEPNAYEALVGRFEAPLYRYFFAAHGDPQLAGEQSADCFSDLVECLPKMRGGPAQLRPFVFSVARNVLRQLWRRRARQRALSKSAANAVPYLSGPDEALEVAEERTRLIDAIRSLDGPTRDVFLLRFIEQMSVAEVADTVGEPIGTVKSRLHRGRQRLREILQSTSGQL